MNSNPGKSRVRVFGSASQNPYPIYDHNLRFSLYPIYDLTKNLETLFVTIAADTVALHIIFEGLLFMGLSIIMKEWRTYPI